MYLSLNVNQSLLGKGGKIGYTQSLWVCMK